MDCHFGLKLFEKNPFISDNMKKMIIITEFIEEITTRFFILING